MGDMQQKVSARTPIGSRLWPQPLDQRLNRLLRPLECLTAPLASQVLQVSMMPKVQMILRKLASPKRRIMLMAGAKNWR